MRWDDSLFTGIHNGWTWLVVRETLPNPADFVIEHHQGHHLCISAFDSGRITPTQAEQSIGWKLVNDLMVSPPLTRRLHIPCDEYYEWYVFSPLPSSLEVPELFVNYGGFNLADPRALAASQDPTWDRANYDWLFPLQERFWANLQRLNPVTYVASGDADVIVTRNPEFAINALALARKNRE